MALNFNYKQRHAREIASAQAVAAHYNVPIREVDITNVKDAMRSCLTYESIPVPHGHYAEESMKATVSPNRNMIMLAIATAYAITAGAYTVAYAAHSGDHAIYPDCRPNFVSAMQDVMDLCHYDPIRLWAPFLYETKASIVQRGLDLKVPYHLTWSCYEGKAEACGKCGTCIERLEAFKLCNAVDPIVYRKEDASAS